MLFTILNGMLLWQCNAMLICITFHKHCMHLNWILRHIWLSNSFQDQFCTVYGRILENVFVCLFGDSIEFILLAKFIGWNCSTKSILPLKRWIDIFSKRRPSKNWFMTNRCIHNENVQFGEYFIRCNWFGDILFSQRKQCIPV